jgi:hypothetical protein
MNKRLFFLKQDGWFEVEITGKLLQATDAELLRWAYATLERSGYRNYLITENPEIQFANMQICQYANGV